VGGVQVWIEESWEGAIGGGLIGEFENRRMGEEEKVRVCWRDLRLGILEGVFNVPLVDEDSGECERRD